MRDLRSDLANLWRSTARITSPHGGRAVMFIAARDGEGVTSMAASFAVMAAARTPRTAWLVDLNLRRNTAYRGFQGGFGGDVGKPGRAYDASLDEEPIYTISPQTVSDGGRPTARHKLLGVHQIQNTRLMVTRFRNERLRQGQRVQLKTQPTWWQALRQAADWIIVDAPAPQSSIGKYAVPLLVLGLIALSSSGATAGSGTSNNATDGGGTNVITGPTDQ